jgi:hypothetical protein
MILLLGVRYKEVMYGCEYSKLEEEVPYFHIRLLSIKNIDWSFIMIYRLKPEIIEVRLFSSVPPFRKDTTFPLQRLVSYCCLWTSSLFILIFIRNS